MQNKYRWLLMLGIFGGALALFCVLAFLPYTRTHTYNGATVTLTRENIYYLPPWVTCTRWQWQVEGINTIHINEVPTVGSGQTEPVCAWETPPNIRVGFRDGTTETYTLKAPSYTLQMGAMFVFLVVFGVFVLLRIPFPSVPTWAEAYGQQQRVRLSFLIVTLTLASLTLIQRTAIAFSQSSALMWDERYYANIAATAAQGLGLYPFMQGYDPTPIMGGVSYATYLYVWAYQWIGTSIFALRVVPVIFTFVALAGFFALTRRLYGSATAFVGLALIPSLFLFQISNSIRMDILVLAHLVWALYLFVDSLEQPSLRRHLWVGLVFGLGLQVHLHTFGVSFAVGFYYLISAIQEAWRQRRLKPLWVSPLSLFVAGYFIAFVFFVGVTILPDPESFFRIAGLARLSTLREAGTLHLDVKMDPSLLTRSFFDWDLLWAKESQRYTHLFDVLSPSERGLWLLALTSLLFRRGKTNTLMQILSIGSMLGGAIILNAWLDIYTIHISVIFLVVAAAFFTHGFQRTEKAPLTQVGLPSLLLFVVFAGIFQPVNTVNNLMHTLQNNTLGQIEAGTDAVEATRAIASGLCHVAARSQEYVPYFTEYPFFTGDFVEVNIGRAYQDMLDEPYTAYWDLRDPDVFVMPFLVELQVEDYVETRNYTEVYPDVWVKPTNLSPDCTIDLTALETIAQR